MDRSHRKLLNTESGKAIFAAQNHCDKVLWLYILCPNNVGRCEHICNASYAVSTEACGLHIGEKLVQDCLAMGKTLGFGVMQFNAVVATNLYASHLYEWLGFTQLGVIAWGGRYEDICLYY